MKYLEEDKVKSSIWITVEPGICDFYCGIQAEREGQRSVRVKILSACEHIQRLAKHLNYAITMKELFSPLSRNPIYIFAERAGCHPSCPIPSGVIKACEVEMEMALPKDVIIRMESDV